MSAVNRISEGRISGPIAARLTPEVKDSAQTKAAEAAQSQSPEAPVDFRASLSHLDDLWIAKRYAEVAKGIASRLEPLSEESIAKLDVQPLMQVISELFVFQQRLIVVANQVSNVSEPEVIKQVWGLQQAIGDLQTAAFRRTLQLVDGNNPDRIEAWQVFKNTMKKPGYHSRTASREYYLQKVEEFLKKGGDFEQLKLVSKEALAALPSGVPCEFVVSDMDVARFARLDVAVPPNHLLLAGGGDVLCAGSLRVFKNEAGDITQVIVGTMSGTYRSGRDPTQHLVRHLIAAGVPKDRIAIQEGESASPRTLPDLLFKLAGVEGAEAQSRMAQLLAQSYAWGPTIAVKPAEDKPAPRNIDAAKKPSPEAQLLNLALVEMKAAVTQAMSDGVILSTTGDDMAIANAVDKVLSLAEKAGNKKAYDQGLGLLRHTAGLPALHIDQTSAHTLDELLTRWDKHVFGRGVFDAADILSPRPTGRRARIMGTIDPTGGTSVTKLQEMIAAGLDVARLNVAHGSIDDHKRTIKDIRAASAALGKNVTILVDLPGPKIRLGKFANPNKVEFNDVLLKTGEKVMLTTAKVEGTPKLLPVEYPPLAKDVKVGDPIFLNDGTVELVATKVYVDPQGHGVVEAEVKNDGKIWDRKGINLPGSKLSIPTVTDEDLVALKALVHEIDLVGISFARTPEDIFFAKGKMAEYGKILPIIAKIERPEALTNLEDIALVADGLMVARGDLGVEIGYENVPAAERRINEVGNLQGKPTIVATEVLQSMVKEGSRPTRAEVEALYSAINGSGADCVMLAKEVSFGKFPAEAIRAAHRVITRAEENRGSGFIAAVAQDPELGTLVGEPMKPFELFARARAKE